MIIEYKFKTQGGATVEGMRTELDRNYSDEETALVFIDNEADDTGGYFELNVRKDAEGHLLPEGYAAYYADTDQTEPEYITEDVELHTTEHDFDETLARANETLLPYGMEIVLEYDGELYWAIASRQKGSCGDEQWYADGDFAHEVRDDIMECLVHVLARVNDPGLAKPSPVVKEKFKVTIIFGENAAKAYMSGGVEEMSEHMSEGSLAVREFDTEAERKAYIMGVDDSDGWLGAAVLSKEDAESEMVKELYDEQ
ncbi:MAG: hypothetical protein IJ551_09860 [Prevotella sp.]|nr:hypothetical protein [Prevotella sp.]